MVFSLCFELGIRCIKLVPGNLMNKIHFAIFVTWVLPSCTLATF